MIKKKVRLLSRMSKERKLLRMYTIGYKAYNLFFEYIKPLPIYQKYIF